MSIRGVMLAYICVTCGVQHDPSDAPPARCEICEDERQYIGRDGQRWTTLDEMRGRYRNSLAEVEPNLIRIVTQPGFAIGQQAYLVVTPTGNVLWDCVSYIDDETVTAVNALGGIAAIAISHPHFYASCVEWSEAFGGAPIHLPAADRRFVMRHSSSIAHFEEDGVEPVADVRVVRLGGHFHGSTVLTWPAGAEGRGVILAGDTIGVVADPRSVTFLYSYPNEIPLAPAEVRGIVDRVMPYDFDRLYGPWSEHAIASDAKQVVRRSAERYIGMVEGTWPRR